MRAGKASDLVQPGDLIVFRGSGFLSAAIELFSDGLSHVAMVLDPRLPVNGKRQREIYLIESTVLNGASGPQVNALAERIASYDAGGCVWHLALGDRVRAFLDWDAVRTYAVKKLAAHDTYNKLELGQYVLRRLPLIQYDPDLYAGNPRQEVCSELAAELYKAGGLPGLKPPETMPSTLAEMAMWGGIQQLKGPARMIARFNTV